MKIRFNDLIGFAPSEETLWTDGQYKIPWNDPEFSQRMLAEHLSQDHDLASRRQDSIRNFTEWLHESVLSSTSSRILDLGCGPGLYAHQLALKGHYCLGMDFGPASIDYAHAQFHQADQCEFELADITVDPFPNGYDLVMMIYGEINVFPTSHSRRILEKAHDALVPGGRVLLETYTLEAVKSLATGPSWHAAPCGLFSSQPYVCLTQGHWFPEYNTNQQAFHILKQGSSDVETYLSTTQGYTPAQYESILIEAGFSNIEFRDDHPNISGFHLISATR